MCARHVSRWPRIETFQSGKKRGIPRLLGTAFPLTRARGLHTTGTDVSYGNLDPLDSLVVCGVAGRTSLGWKPGVIDKVFDLLGDFNHDGQADYGSVSATDYTIWQDQNGVSSAFEHYADDDDDGAVNSADYTIWSQNFGHALQLFDVGPQVARSQRIARVGSSPKFSPIRLDLKSQLLEQCAPRALHASIRR
jgi:hypothetical protein